MTSIQLTDAELDRLGDFLNDFVGDNVMNLEAANNAAGSQSLCSQPRDLSGVDGVLSGMPV